MKQSVNLPDLGRRIRAARLARRLTLEDVVSRTGFTASWLSKVETGRLCPSLEGLVMLAEVIECGVDTLVEGLSVPPRFVVVKAGTGTVMPSRNGRGGLVVETLADQWRGRAMSPKILHVSGGVRQPENHEGERFLLVLDGDVRVTYGGEQIELAPGDSLYIDATVSHAIGAVGKQTARVLSVSCDPGGHAGDGRARGRQRPASADGAAGRRGSRKSD